MLFMQVEMWLLDRIKPYEKNPRINDDAVDPVVQSINEFGFRQPIVVDPDGVIIVGHRRWKATTKIGSNFPVQRCFLVNLDRRDDRLREWMQQLPQPWPLSEACSPKCNDAELQAFVNTRAIPQCGLCPSWRKPFQHPDPTQRSELL